MSRYIDADAVKINYIGGFKDTFEVDYNSFMNAPSINIVFCKECKFENTRKCPPHRMGLIHEADDFCSYGERKESE